MEYRVSRFPMPSRFLLTANGKDFSLALEMTCGRRSPLIVFHTAVDSSQPKPPDKIKRTNYLHDWFFPLISSLFLPAIPANRVYSLKSKQKGHPCRCPFMLISSFLSSRAASSQVLSAFVSLTTVFGMGTGVSSQLSPLNR